MDNNDKTETEHLVQKHIHYHKKIKKIIYNTVKYKASDPDKTSNKAIKQLLIEQFTEITSAPSYLFF